MAVDDSAEAPVPFPITDELDLHTFRPREIASLLEDYFNECRARRIYSVRVIHGKGLGTLRETVHAQLRKSPAVLRFALCDETSGGWGATRVTLKPANST
ncbi:Smr/MutS family protein [Oleiharenicola lentus]|uniref:Smr/MutS family protein n=1 Tax=Oleiharenicola lentus TaxID=2508720 RepID=UPI003F67B248